MTGRHAQGRGHGSWTPAVPRPAWPLAVHMSGAHRAVQPVAVAALASPGERTLRLPAFVRGGRRG